MSYPGNSLLSRINWRHTCSRLHTLRFVHLSFNLCRLLKPLGDIRLSILIFIYIQLGMLESFMWGVFWLTINTGVESSIFLIYKCVNNWNNTVLFNKLIVIEIYYLKGLLAIFNTGTWRKYKVIFLFIFFLNLKQLFLYREINKLCFLLLRKKMISIDLIVMEEQIFISTNEIAFISSNIPSD
jgi:hypothetical protein